MGQGATQCRTKCGSWGCCTLLGGRLQWGIGEHGRRARTMVGGDRGVAGGMDERRGRRGNTILTLCHVGLVLRSGVARPELSGLLAHRLLDDGTPGDRVEAERL